jgi:membrane protein DedA with SNARE-associated domain
MIEDQNSWKYKWSFKEFLPKGLLGLLIALILIFIGGRYKGININKFNGDWGALIFVVGAMFLVFIILWLLDVIRNRKKNPKSNENK